jgi:hypothetical protein
MKTLANATIKAVKRQYNKRNEEIKEQKRKDILLFKKTNGNIPCLNECGYFKQKTKDEVLTDIGNTFICKECSEKLGNDVNKLFFQKDIYKIYGIE